MGTILDVLVEPTLTWIIGIQQRLLTLVDSGELVMIYFLVENDQVVSVENYSITEYIHELINYVM